MRKQLEKRAADAVTMARKAGADNAWAQAQRVRVVDFTMRDGKLEEVQDSTTRGLSLRLFVNGRFSSNGTTDLRPEKLQAFVRETVALTRALQPDPHRVLPDPARFRGQPTGLDLVDAAVPNLDRTARLDRCGAMNARVVGKPGVISASSSVSDVHAYVGAASSNGFSSSYETTQVGMYTSVTLKDGDKRPADGMGTRGRHMSVLLNPEDIADQALARTRASVGATKGRTQRTSLVVENRAARSIIRRLLGPARGNAVQQQRSFFVGRQGKPMFSDKLTIIDDPTIARALGSRPFDSEGMAAKRMLLIERGVFRNYYLDTYYAHKLNMQATSGESFNQIVVPGEQSPEQLLGAVGTGVFVTSWLGGNMDSTTGDFSIGLRGRLIENGRLGAPVSEMNATGNAVELFARLAAVGNDPWMFSTVRVPTLVFEGVQLSGA